MNEKMDIVMSPLCRSFESDGKTVQIDILGDGDGGWLLEVIDEFGNSSVWDDSFSSEKAALDEALDTIAEEGIESLIGSPSESANQ
jgi:uncharacterized protein